MSDKPNPAFVISGEDGTHKPITINTDVPTPSGNSTLSPSSAASHDGSLRVPGSGALERRGSVTSVAPTIARSDHSAIAKTSNFVRNITDALAPGLLTVSDYVVDDGENDVFGAVPGELNRMFGSDQKLAAFYTLGGLPGLAEKLKTNLKDGLGGSDEELVHDPKNVREIPGLQELLAAKKAASADSGSDKDKSKAKKKKKEEEENLPVKPIDVADFSTGYRQRKMVFSDNRLPTKATKGFWGLFLEALKDKMMVILAVAGIVSLIVGAIEAAKLPHAPGEPRIEWVEGLAILLAILIVVTFSSGMDTKRAKQFAKLDKKNAAKNETVIRQGKPTTVLKSDLMAGDIVVINTGDVIGADGVLIKASSLKCTEAAATGEPHPIAKMSGEDVMAALEDPNTEDVTKLDPFVYAGAQVTEGTGLYLVVSAGIYSQNGKALMLAQGESEPTPLEVALANVAEKISFLGFFAGGLMFVVLIIQFGLWTKTAHAAAAVLIQKVVQIIITCIALVVAAVPEGLPLAVTLSLAFATSHLYKENNLVRKLASCETMGGVTQVCSDKTGTLTEGNMKVVAGHLCTEEFDFTTAADQSTITNARDLAEKLDKSVQQLFQDALVYNTTVVRKPEELNYGGNPTEVALLNFAEQALDLGESVIDIRAANPFADQYPFDSKYKCMGTVMPIGENRYRLFAKGASEEILKRCTHRLKGLTRPLSGKDAVEITVESRESLEKAITKMAERSLRTIGVCYRDFTSTTNDFKAIPVLDMIQGSTMIGIVGIQDPVRATVPDAIKQCQRAGVTVRMVTGDNRITAQAIATECGILTETESNRFTAVMKKKEKGEELTDQERKISHLVIEGPDFRQHFNSVSPDWDLIWEIAKHNRVMGRSSPEDKRTLVKTLQSRGETVAVTGDGTNDAPALKMSDIGFAMGIAGTDVAKEACDIVLMDDNFASIVQALKWGRAVNESVRKFLQFQLAVNLAAIFVTFITAVWSSSQESVLSAVQLLWINLIMDSFAAVALATDPPADSILDKQPVRKGTPVITFGMFKMIMGQAIYQTIVILILYKYVDDWLNLNDPVKAKTIVFNTFVWMQIFNMVNCRTLGRNYNIFENIHRNYWFGGVFFVMVLFQTIIVNWGSAAFSVEQINGFGWLVTIGFALITFPVGVLMRALGDWDGWLWSESRRERKLEEARVGAKISAKDRVRGYVRRRRGDRLGYFTRSTTSLSFHSL